MSKILDFKNHQAIELLEAKKRSRGESFMSVLGFALGIEVEILFHSP